MASSARIDELRKKFEENPRRYFAPLANEYRKAGDIEQAIAICREYLPQQPGHMSGHIVYGQALFEAREVEEAKTVFETALSLDPENLIALRHLGDIALLIGDSPAARVWYGRVLEADPRNEEIQAQLAAIDQSAQASPTPVTTSLVEDVEPAPVPDTSSRPTPLSSPTVVVSARPRPQTPTPARPVDAQSAVPEVEISLSKAPTVEVKVDAIVPPTLQPSADETLEIALGMVPTSAAPPPQSAPADTLQIETTAPDSSAQPVIESFSLEGLETTSLSGEAPSSGAPVPTESVSQPAAPPVESVSSSAPPLVESTLPPEPPPVEITQPMAPAAPQEPEEELPLLDIGELPSVPVASTPTPEPLPPAPEPVAIADLAPEPAPVSDALPLIDIPAPTTEVADWTPPPAEPAMESAPAAPDSGPFVTETMAELYLHQGHRDEALRVYRALLEQRPGDASLAAKVAALSPPVAPSPAVPVEDAGPTIRELLAAIASRRPGARAEPPHENGATPEAAHEPTSARPDALAALFGAVQISAPDESAATALALAFLGVDGLDRGDSISGAPARHAGNDLSLDAVFKAAAPSPAAPSSFSFDQFFSQRATAEHTTQRNAQTASDPESRDDVAQFTQWLEGLKQR